MNHRWYDNDPTLSMAVSLLQNASRTHQELTARYIFHQLESENLLDSDILRTQEDRVRFMFPSRFRQKLDVQSRRLLEVLKLLPYEVQQRMALQMIQYIYVLDAGECETPDMAELGPGSIPLASPESG